MFFFIHLAYYIEYEGTSILLNTSMYLQTMFFLVGFQEGTGNMQRIWIAEYLMALIAQLFLYCWHSNDVLYMVSEHFYLLR